MKQKVLKHFPEAHCVKLAKAENRYSWIVWPSMECSPRGIVRFAIGFGATPAQAWKDAWEDLQETHKKPVSRSAFSEAKAINVF